MLLAVASLLPPLYVASATALTRIPLKRASAEIAAGVAVTPSVVASVQNGFQHRRGTAGVYRIVFLKSIHRLPGAGHRREMHDHLNVRVLRGNRFPNTDISDIATNAGRSAK